VIGQTELFIALCHNTDPWLVVVVAVDTSPIVTHGRDRVRAKDSGRCHVDWSINGQSWVNECRITGRVVYEERLKIHLYDVNNVNVLEFATAPSSAFEKRRYTPCLKNTAPALFLNNSMKRQPTLIIFGTQHQEARHKRLYFCPPHLNTVAALPCEMQKS